MKGHIRKRGLKSWAIVLELDRDADGKRRQRWHSVKGSKRDAERELARLVHEFDAQHFMKAGVKPQRKQMNTRQQETRLPR